MKLNWEAIKKHFADKRAALGAGAPTGVDGRITQGKLSALVGCNDRTMRRYVSGDFGQMDADFFDAVSNTLLEYGFSMDEIWETNPETRQIRPRNERG